MSNTEPFTLVIGPFVVPFPQIALAAIVIVLLILAYRRVMAWANKAAPEPERYVHPYEVGGELFGFPRWPREPGEKVAPLQIWIDEGKGKS